jgi:hypothetical protein
MQLSQLLLFCEEMNFYSRALEDCPLYVPLPSTVHMSLCDLMYLYSSKSPLRPLYPLYSVLSQLRPNTSSKASTLSMGLCPLYGLLLPPWPLRRSVPSPAICPL